MGFFTFLKNFAHAHTPKVSYYITSNSTSKNSWSLYIMYRRDIRTIHDTVYLINLNNIFAGNLSLLRITVIYVSLKKYKKLHKKLKKKKKKFQKKKKKKKKKKKS